MEPSEQRTLKKAISLTCTWIIGQWKRFYRLLPLTPTIQSKAETDRVTANVYSLTLTFTVYEALPFTVADSFS